MINKTGAIVIGGDYQGLGIIRSLAKENIPVFLVDSSTCIAMSSKWTGKFFKAPSEENEKFIKFMLQLAEREKLSNWVIFPTTDSGVKTLSINKQLLSQYYNVPMSEWQITEIFHNKKLTYKLAIESGVPIPQTLYNIENVSLQFPVIIKPAVKGYFYKKTKKKALLARNMKELISLYKFTTSLIGKEEIMIQEVIPGGASNLFSFCSMFKNGNVIASICARRLRQHPMDFGKATTYVEIVHLPELEELGRKLLVSAKYYGLSEIEFMWDPRDRKYKLIEVNPRTWGWHTLGLAAGINFPYILYKDLTRCTDDSSSFAKQTVASGKVSGTWVRLLTDMPTSLEQIITGKLNINDYISSLDGRIVYAVWDISDPLPFFKELFLLPYFWKTRGF